MLMVVVLAGDYEVFLMVFWGFFCVGRFDRFGWVVVMGLACMLVYWKLFSVGECVGFRKMMSTEAVTSKLANDSNNISVALTFFMFY